MIEKIIGTDSVSLHVRRSDYIGSYFAGICTLEYYAKTVEYMRKHIQKSIFFVFSDDIPWCKEHLNLADNVYFIDWNKGKDSYKDLILMSNCKHNIIANSSFSWWGARLNNNPTKIVIAPHKWHQNLDYKDIIPSDWIKI